MTGQTGPGADAGRWLRRGWWLVLATLGYNVVESAVGVWAGTRADSIALLGFGLDSLLELVAGAALAWRLGRALRQTRVPGVGADPAADTDAPAERLALRVVGATFLALALYVGVEAVRAFAGDVAPRTSAVGIVLAAASLLVMPGLAAAKLRVAGRLGSRALRAEARETLACAYLSLTLLLGLGAHAAFGWAWADPAAAALMVPWLVREGLESLGGEEEDEE